LAQINGPNFKDVRVVEVPLGHNSLTTDAVPLPFSPSLSSFLHLRRAINRSIVVDLHSGQGHQDLRVARSRRERLRAQQGSRAGGEAARRAQQQRSEGDGAGRRRRGQPLRAARRSCRPYAFSTVFIACLSILCPGFLRLYVCGKIEPGARDLAWYPRQRMTARAVSSVDINAHATKRLLIVSAREILRPLFCADCFVFSFRRHRRSVVLIGGSSGCRTRRAS
jgi:hypothetical protein